MSSSTAPPQAPPVLWEVADLWRLSVDRYHQMIAAGVITPDDRVELLEGALINKPPNSPAHRLSVVLVCDAFRTAVPPGWHLQTEQPVAMDDSQPEPDVAVVRGKARDYSSRHPVPTEVLIIIEVADSSLRRDREDKRRIYARNGIAVYWIVNVADRIIDVFTNPSGPVHTPDYGTTTTYGPTDVVPVVLAATTVATVKAADLLP